MKWFAKTNIGEFNVDGDEKFLSATIKEGEDVQDILDWYTDQWKEESESGILDINNVYIYIMPWHPTTYKAYNDVETGEIGWEPC